MSLQKLLSIAKRASASLGARTLRLAPFHGLGHRAHSLVRQSQERNQSTKTRFYRNVPQIETVVDLVRERTSDPSDDLRVVVMGCSTGAEVYSLVSYLAAVRPNLTVLAIDIDDDALARAAAATYLPGDPELIQVPADRLSTVCQLQDGRYVVRPEIRNCITFMHGDACNREFLNSIGQFDVVLANNFLIHMGPFRAYRTVTRLHQLMKDDGLFCVSGIDPDVRERMCGLLPLEPLATNLQSIHEGDALLASGWPFQYWGTEPFNDRHPRRGTRYATLFKRSNHAAIRPLHTAIGASLHPEDSLSS